MIFHGYVSTHWNGKTIPHRGALLRAPETIRSALSNCRIQDNVLNAL